MNQFALFSAKSRYIGLLFILTALFGGLSPAFDLAAQEAPADESPAAPVVGDDTLIRDYPAETVYPLPNNNVQPQVIPPDGPTVAADQPEGLTIPFVDLSVRSPESNQEVALSLQLLILLGIITLSPSIILLMTSFLRVAIVFNFIRQALSLQQVPPAAVLMGIALFLTMFIMWPTFTQIYDQALAPFSSGELNTEDFFDQALAPIRVFMFRQLSGNYNNISLFMSMSGLSRPQTAADVPTYVLIPAFILHELTVAFKMGILLFVPFIIIDMVVASTLMSMGMIMLPPVMISLPFKLIVFVLADGWGMITQEIIRSFA